MKPAGSGGSIGNIPRQSTVRAVPPISQTVVPGQTPRQTSTRMPAAGGPPGGIQTDRAKLGLGAKPSEMIEGLDEVAKRLEKQQERENAKSKSGGKMNQNEALLTDDTGRRWSRNVMIGIVVLVLLGGAGFGAMMIKANFTAIDPRQGNATTRRMMMELIGFAQRIPADDAESLTKDKVVELLHEQVDAQYKQVEADIQRDKERREKEGKHRPPDTRLYRELENLTELRKFKDPWGQPLEFDISAGTLTIKGKGSPKGDPIEPVSTRLGKKAAEKSPPAKAK